MTSNRRADTVRAMYNRHIKGDVLVTATVENDKIVGYLMAVSLPKNYRPLYYHCTDLLEIFFLFHRRTNIAYDEITAKNMAALHDSYDAGYAHDTNSMDPETVKEIQSLVVADSPIQLKPYQIAGIHAGSLKMKNFGGVLLMDPMGVGKTVQAAVLAARHTKNIVVVAPTMVASHWVSTFKDVLGMESVVVRTSSSWAKVPKDAVGKVIIVPYGIFSQAGSAFNTLSKICENASDMCLLVDEAHYISDRKSMRTKRALLIGSKCKYKICVTGTPMPNCHMNIYNIIKLLNVKTLGDHAKYWDFAKHYCGAYRGTFGYDMRRSTNPEELNMRLRATIGIRREKEVVLPQLPPKTFTIAELGWNKRGIIKPHLNVVNKGLAQLELSRKDSLGKVPPNIMTARCEMVMALMDEYVDYILHTLTKTDKVILIAYNKVVMAALEERLQEYHAQVINGDTPSSKRQSIINSFNGDEECRVIILQISTAVGITLNAASTVIFVQSSYCPADIMQASDRCHRIGQKRHVQVTFLIPDQSIERVVLSTAIQKAKSQEITLR